MARSNTYAMGDIARIVADAVVTAANEHGAHNSFCPGELVAFYADGAYLTPMQVGRAAPLTVGILRDRGWVVDYSDRHFRITAAGEGYDD